MEMSWAVMHKTLLDLIIVYITGEWAVMNYQYMTAHEQKWNYCLTVGGNFPTDY